MARPKKVESDRLFAVRMLYEACQRFEDQDDGKEALDILTYWSDKVAEILIVQRSVHHEISQAGQ